MNNYAFSMTMEVRNYECDLQGIVNNGVYQNYLAHVRHEFLKQNGIDFAEYARQGINLVVIRAELDYKLPLVPGDRFTIGINTARESKARFVFYQDIYRAEDEKLVLKAKIIGTALNERGRPSIPKQLEQLFP
uniref:Acyl-CoA thioester hydrolase n=1 Tax=Candidatus Kentrum sp. MB TaxID=2138164 RepID=A0A450XSC5_9GAMM|nr:MAG: acyl-CoA thioester hydrolase [Candidatus Kentron sp. MB]VFK34615.1 MAG: acyl-CoA thioester hydrolase [Candidatus Kentron sp. MB]VFK76852.1 MAG: acyl-CoA thioester hydrolase [Candidatus Kentron sp. MB]